MAAFEFSEESDANKPALLCWDTSTERAILAVGVGGRLVVEEFFTPIKGHTGWLMPLLDARLKEIGIAQDDLEVVSVGIGPGGFTGVKVGVSTAKAVSEALGIPIIPVPTLQLVAASAHERERLTVAILDAKGGYFYCGFYDCGGRLPYLASDYMCEKPEAIARRLEKWEGEGFLVVGDVSEEIRISFEELEREIEFVGLFPRGRDLLELSMAMFEDNMQADPQAVIPIYLKKPV
ncbi:MAG: tRNA (adenosine(37)-N6)-threonylcarbamoyltransferase complex dimerization subunit type 1 TsaB [Actinomycetota bacterium]|nr:tRNA (adenosine(37)-N6)-threonylcarbamoyltransferase complex dimerization subunit type 1 TsaB [Actinomycetota bacterium]